MGWIETPYVHVTINDVPIAGVLRAVIINTNSFASDTFVLTFALGPTPLTNAAYWSALKQAQVSVFARTSSGGEDCSLMVGLGDSIHVDPIHAIATIEGRDLSARLIDSFTQEGFVNQTASAVVERLAQRHGLQVIATATTANVGRYYGDGYTKLTLGQFSRFRSDWDVVTHLARQNGFDAYVIGSTLYFEPIAVSSEIIPLATADVTAIHFDRMIAFTDPQLKFQSWNSQDMMAHASKLPTSTGAGFLFGGANLSANDVDLYTEKYAAELDRLRTVLSIKMPWRMDLMPRTRLLLTGTASSFDALYTIDSIERFYCTSSGSMQHIRAVLA